MTEVEHMVGPWRDMAVVPIRKLRRALKSPPPVMVGDAAEGLRTRIVGAIVVAIIALIVLAALAHL